MSVLIVGADRLGNILSKMQAAGTEEIIHWSGRDSSCKNRSIPKNVERIVVFCDFINHSLMFNIKKQAKKEKVPIIYSKRSLSYKVDSLYG